MVHFPGRPICLTMRIVNFRFWAGKKPETLVFNLGLPREGVRLRSEGRSADYAMCVITYGREYMLEENLTIVKNKCAANAESADIFSFQLHDDMTTTK
jgi:hypothetical protein